VKLRPGTPRRQGQNGDRDRAGQEDDSPTTSG
jgi:hypothetical protein